MNEITKKLEIIKNSIGVDFAREIANKNIFNYLVEIIICIFVIMVGLLIIMDLWTGYKQRDRQKEDAKNKKLRSMCNMYDWDFSSLYPSAIREFIIEPPMIDKLYEFIKYLLKTKKIFLLYASIFMILIGIIVCIIASYWIFKWTNYPEITTISYIMNTIK